MQTRITEQARATHAVASILANMTTYTKNSLLTKMADKLEANAEYILQENERDLMTAKDKGISDVMLDRLRLTSTRIKDMAEGVRQVSKLNDPIGEVEKGTVRPNGLSIKKVRVPLGVIGIIYESRPNVTVDAVALCIKSGNAVILRGGSEAIHSNTALVKVLKECLTDFNLPTDLINFIDITDRQAVNCMLKLNQYIDVIIPRGGAGLIRTVVENSNIPVIETGIGVCHVFVDESADYDMATKIIINAKTSRPSVCNAIEALLIHKSVAPTFAPHIIRELQSKSVTIKGCAETQKYGSNILLATSEDYACENLDLVISIKIVDDISEAIAHITKFGSKHSESIVTKNYDNAKLFQQQVDAAVVYVNVSTRFTDGFEFGFGAEIGISTQKIHARGPMGLAEMTSSKYIVDGNGQIR